MTIKMPKIEINFKQKATSLIERSERGYAILVMRDNTNALFNYKVYKDISEVEEDEAAYKADNYQYIKDAFEFGAYRVIIAKVGEDKEKDKISAAFKIILENIDTGWITLCDGSEDEFATLASWIKSQENNKKTYKAIVYKVATTDSMHIVNFYNDKVTFVDKDRGEQTGEKYLPSLAGILAKCNVTRGCTYFKCTNLSKVEEVEDNDAALGQGHFILFNDKDYVRIATDVNSLTTTNGNTLTEDMKYIETVEAMDLILDDIREEFRSNYLGNYRNNYDNQMLFISAVNGYFDSLAEEDILDPDYSNRAQIDVTKQRKSWVASGKEEAAEWDDVKVRRTPYKRNVYLAGDIKILGSMANLEFNISLF